MNADQAEVGLRLGFAVGRRVVGEVSAGLRAAGVEFAVLKGVGLAERLYREPWRRVSTDVDVLVRRRDLGRAEAVLRGMGYSEAGGDRSLKLERIHTVMVRDGYPAVELHYRWMSLAGPWYEADEFLERRVAGPEGVDVLAPEDEFLFLCAHAAKHQFAGEKWMTDLELFVEKYPGIDWGEVERRCGALRIQTCVWMTVEKLRERGVRVPMDCRANAVVRALWPRVVPRSASAEFRASLGNWVEHLFYAAVMRDSLWGATGYVCARVMKAARQAV